MALSRREINKDMIQQATEAAIGSIGRLSAILFGTVREITTEVGSFATELFEIREASYLADADADRATDETNPPS